MVGVSNVNIAGWLAVAVSLAIGVVSLWRTRGLPQLQRRLGQLELDRHADEIRRRREEDARLVTASLRLEWISRAVPLGDLRTSNEHVLIVTNDGPAIAMDVDVEQISSGATVLPRRNERLLPRETLDAQASIELRMSTAWKSEPVVRFRMTWRDGRGRNVVELDLSARKG